MSSESLVFSFNAIDKVCVSVCVFVLVCNFSSQPKAHLLKSLIGPVLWSFPKVRYTYLWDRAKIFIERK